LEQLAAVALEVSRRPELLGTFLGILRLAVPTLEDLFQERRAARWKSMAGPNHRESAGKISRRLSLLLDEL
jgi:hypothetical protein